MPAMPSKEEQLRAMSKWPNWVRNFPFLLLHVGCLAVFLPFIHATPTALTLCVVFYLVRMFGITGVYHRYFSHRAYKTSRWFQFVLAWLGCAAMQKGPLWWAGHHRHHHRHSDQDEDIHSPIKRSLWWSHVGWVISPEHAWTDWDGIHDFAKYPELRWLDRWHWLPGLSVMLICYLIDGLNGLVWGFLVSTVLCYHATFCINSLCHLWGSVRYKTTDESKNSLMLALITLGEGWHNNHHYYQSSANQGFFWWEIDISYCVLILLSKVGLVWDLRGVPQRKRMAHRIPVAEPIFAPFATGGLGTAAGALAGSLATAAGSVSESISTAAGTFTAAAGSVADSVTGSISAAADSLSAAAGSMADSVVKAAEPMVAAVSAAVPKATVAVAVAAPVVVAAAVDTSVTTGS